MRRQPGNPHARAWLRVGGSLTAQLRRHGAVRIVVLREGPQAFWPQERKDLGRDAGYVREVLILVNGRAAVWARSTTALAAVKGPWRALASLGSRPLAELLFHDRSITRSALVSEQVVRCSPGERHVHRSLQQQAHSLVPFRPRWARSSVFSRQGQTLRVYESFAPWVLDLPCMRGPACALR